METRSKRYNSKGEKQGCYLDSITSSNGHSTTFKLNHTASNREIIAFANNLSAKNGETSIGITVFGDEERENLIESLEFAVKSLKEMANKNK